MSQISTYVNLLLKVTSTSNVITTRKINMSPVNFLIQKWRKEKGLPMNPNAYGVLTDRPDFSYLDGRPTPLGVHQKRRLLKQKEIADKIIQLSKEIDFAVERQNRVQLEEQQKKQKIIDSKLKPKGLLLLKKK